tara:strand:- start:217 stop:804 length:588 start_codon:yes stop_codon:yes gene_type:complete
MDILYYSNYCKFSKKLISLLSRNKTIKESISFICIDNRTIDEKTNQVFIVLENGSKIVKPPNLHSVPALLLIKEKYNILYGDEIIDKLRPIIISETQEAEQHNGEPLSFQFNNNNTVVSEKYTYYNLSSEELSAKGVGGRRNLQNYVSVNQDIMTIKTPDDNYKPDKVGNVTVDKLMEKRNNDLENKNIPPQLEY